MPTAGGRQHGPLAAVKAPDYHSVKEKSGAIATASIPDELRGIIKDLGIKQLE